MATVTFGTDESADRALAELTANGSTVSDAIGKALADACGNVEVMTERIVAVAPERLGELVGHLSHDELADVAEPLRLALALD